MPKMTHPDSKQIIDVSPAQRAMYESQGWVVKTSAKAKQDSDSESESDTSK